jgi:hypothetical protein
MGRECSTHGEKRNAYRILVGKPEGKRLLGRHRRRIRLKWISEIGWGGMHWIHLAHSSEPSGSIKYWEITEWLSDWRLLLKDSSP